MLSMIDVAGFLFLDKRYRGKLVRLFECRKSILLFNFDDSMYPGQLLVL